MRLLVVTQYHPFMEKVSEHHGRYGNSLMMRQMFVRLSQTPAVVDDQDMEFIEAFVIIMYDRTTTTFAVNKARFKMLARKQRQPGRRCSNIQKGQPIKVDMFGTSL